MNSTDFNTCKIKDELLFNWSLNDLITREDLWAYAPCILVEKDEATQIATIAIAPELKSKLPPSFHRVDDIPQYKHYAIGVVHISYLEILNKSEDSLIEELQDEII